MTAPLQTTVFLIIKIFIMMIFIPSQKTDLRIQFFLYSTLGLLGTYVYFRAIFWFQNHRTTKIYNLLYGYYSNYQFIIWLQLNGFPALLSLCTSSLVLCVTYGTTQVPVLSLISGLLSYIVTRYVLFYLYRPLFSITHQDQFKKD